MILKSIAYVLMLAANDPVLCLLAKTIETDYFFKYGESFVMNIKNADENESSRISNNNTNDYIFYYIISF